MGVGRTIFHTTRRLVVSSYQESFCFHRRKGESLQHNNALSTVLRKYRDKGKSTSHIYHKTLAMNLCCISYNHISIEQRSISQSTKPRLIQKLYILICERSDIVDFHIYDQFMIHISSKYFSNM
jgi:hypothetical protein